jgi:hypothetical protein
MGRLKRLKGEAAAAVKLKLENGKTLSRGAITETETRHISPGTWGRSHEQPCV